VAPKEETVAPDWRNQKGPRAAHRKSISQHAANDERKQAQPFTPNKPGLSGSSGLSHSTKQTRQTEQTK
jgi:hypothetical protein